MCINGMSVYTAKRNPLKAFRNKTDEYVDDQVMLGGRFSAKGFQDSVGGGGGGGGGVGFCANRTITMFKIGSIGDSI